MGRSVELVAEESPDAIQAQAFDAAKTGDLNALQDALANGAELEARNAPYRDTVLNIAITHGNTDLAVWLLEQGADANTGGGGRTALHNAIFRDNLARIDHRFGNEGDFGRPERFSESFAIDPVQVE